jgi:hypothetical protein
VGQEYERCPVKTGRLNCGCCGDVELNCDLPAERYHREHEMTLDTTAGERIRWYYINGGNERDIAGSAGH